MAGNRKKTERLEISSDQLREELIEIKERVGALETIASISNRPVVEKYVRSNLASPHGKRIMAECETPKTKKELQDKLGHASGQALDYHLRPLREADLLQSLYDDESVLRFEWSNLFRRLPAKAIKEILDVSK